MATTPAGQGGADTFAFTTALGAGNVDTIVDFDGDDIIALDNAVFTGLADGALDPNAFVVGTAAHDADDRIIYDNATGNLYFDADGSGTGSAAVLFAMLQNGRVLTAKRLHRDLSGSSRYCASARAAAFFASVSARIRPVRSTRAAICSQASAARRQRSRTFCKGVAAASRRASAARSR